jgi:hypothetical protein
MMTLSSPPPTDIIIVVVGILRHCTDYNFCIPHGKFPSHPVPPLLQQRQVCVAAEAQILTLYQSATKIDEEAPLL